MNSLTKSPKTTGAGIAALLALAAGAAGLLLDGDPATSPQWSLIVPEALAILGLIFARDHNVSSEAAGAK